MGVQLLLVLVAVVAAGEICYDRLGCFSVDPPYSLTPQRPIARIPWHPKVINTRFLLFTRENPKHFEEISALNVSSVLETKFDPRKKSCFIIHGFLEEGNKTWLVDMCQTLLQVEDVNCFCVDWVGGSIAWYTQAANNVRVVGAEVAYFIIYLMDHFNYPLSDVHLIGHSLGAQVAGEAGKRCPGIGRITGLDPAGPYFKHTPLEVRLDPSDAALVDVIHTDGSPTILHLGLGGFGMKQLAGHLDFFPNGGEQMPGCPHTFVKPRDDLDHTMEGIAETILCNHHRSFMYFTQSILHPDGFVGYPGPSYSKFQEGAGFPCSEGDCMVMGYYANTRTLRSARGSFFLNTGDAENLLCWRYRVTVSIIGRLFVTGSFSVSLCSRMGCSPHYVIHSGLMHSGRSYSSFIDVETDVHPVKKVEFVWHKEVRHRIQPTLGATAVMVQHGPSGKISYFGDRRENPPNPEALFLIIHVPSLSAE